LSKNYHKLSKVVKKLSKSCKIIVNKGPSTLAFFASVVPSAMAPPPNSFLCFSCVITYVKKQRKLLGSGAIADGETDAKNASVDGP
jgi:hypothetical protein